MKKLLRIRVLCYNGELMWAYNMREDIKYA